MAADGRRGHCMLGRNESLLRTDELAWLGPTEWLHPHCPSLPWICIQASGPNLFPRLTGDWGEALASPEGFIFDLLT